MIRHKKGAKSTFDSWQSKNPISYLYCHLISRYQTRGELASSRPTTRTRFLTDML